MPEGYSWLDERPSRVAHRLLGHELVVGDRVGRIVEVEAYEGSNDQASHAKGRVTDRNRIMFGPPGHLYVYRSYGVHWCANLVCHPDGEPGAILVRAIEPMAGVEQMWADRPKARKETDLGSGPGKLCAALGIDGDHDGVFVFSRSSPVRLRPSRPGPAPTYVTGPRIGISVATDLPWRFCVVGSGHVSRPRPS